MAIKMEEVRYIESVNLNKFQEAVVSVGKGPCVKFDCPRQALCAEEEVECKAF